MTTRQSPTFQSLTTTEQAAHLLSIAKPDPARLQREYEAAMLEKAKADPDTSESMPEEKETPPNPEALAVVHNAVVSFAIREQHPPRTENITFADEVDYGGGGDGQALEQIY